MFIMFTKVLSDFSTYGKEIALATADTDLTTAATAMATTIQENLIAVITTNLPTIAVVGLTIVAIGLVWYFMKRFVSGA